MIDKKLRIFKVDENIFENNLILNNRESCLGIDITPLFKEMFGKNLLIQKAFVLCDNMLNRSDAQNIADNIVVHYNRSLQRKRGTIDFGAEEIYLTLKDGSIFRLYSSEWGSLSKLN